MKPVSMLLCGIVVSSLAAPVLAQPPQAWNWRPDRPASLEARQQDDARNHGFTPPAPRGDLRGDIASNVRERPDPPRGDPQRRR